jgi:hypothetical protein
MPFTISHAAATVPLLPLVRRLRLPLAAVAIGTMAPDFEYFIHLRTLSLWGHSVVGLVLFDLPAGLLVLGAWEFVAREPVRDLLGLAPVRCGERGGPSSWAHSAAAIVIGAATHIVWDSFTHADRWGVRHLPELRTSAASIGEQPLPWFIVLDHLSTVVGGVIVVGWLAREMWRAAAFRKIAQSSWRCAVLLALALITVSVGLWNGFRQSPALDYWSSELWLAQATVGAQVGLCLAVLVYSMTARASQLRRWTQ